MKKSQFSLLFISIIFLPLQGYSQEKFQKSITVSYESGPFTSTGQDWSEALNEIIEFRAIDAKIGWQRRNPNYMDDLYRNPNFGLGFTTALPYFEEIGKPMAVYGFFEFPFGRNLKNNRLRFGYFGQLGLGFNANPYDEQNNPLNNYLGSSVNGYVHLGLNGKYRITDRLDLTATLGLKHYSNGASTKPNKGLNMVPIGIGLSTKIGRPIARDVARPIYPDLEKRGFWNIAAYLGRRSYEIGEPSYFRGGLGVNYLWEASYKYRLGLGIDVFYAAGLEKRFPDQSFGLFDKTSIALVGSWEWKISDRLFVPIALGVYVYRTDLNQEFTQYYERIGVRYRIDDQISAGFAIKAHKAKADFFEFTLGYTIPGKVKYSRPHRTK
ncbi:acyloxyacyl hydrolase [Algoriphagus namhaensis]|uniref:Acyloxyacyl hydrolase n=1 Tax=Algoriphagus namhaensis TaxID=915353 RepID=A0ABV8AXE2_9BACT